MSKGQIAALKAVIWLCCLAPFAWLAVRAFGVAGTSLGANPVQTVLHTCGKTGLNILLVTLAVTPIRMLTHVNALVRVRRLLGLFSFFYLVLHLLTYAALDLRLQWNTLWVDVSERPYITVGMLALIGMIPLAVTSTKGMQKRLGRRWVKLHRLIYPIAILGVLHFFWQVKADITEPLVYSAVLAVLLGYRVARSQRVQRLARAGSSALGL
jgi:sulfoxide reductase heme-binding subunit YedZ